MAPMQASIPATLSPGNRYCASLPERKDFIRSKSMTKMPEPQPRTSMVLVAPRFPVPDLRTSVFFTLPTREDGLSEPTKYPRAILRAASIKTSLSKVP